MRWLSKTQDGVCTNCQSGHQNLSNNYPLFFGLDPDSGVVCVQLFIAVVAHSVELAEKGSKDLQMSPTAKPITIHKTLKSIQAQPRDT